MDAAEFRSRGSMGLPGRPPADLEDPTRIRKRVGGRDSLGETDLRWPQIRQTNQCCELLQWRVRAVRIGDAAFTDARPSGGRSLWKPRRRPAKILAARFHYDGGDVATCPHCEAFLDEGHQCKNVWQRRFRLGARIVAAMGL